MRRTLADGIVLYQVEAWLPVPGLVHGALTRLGGASRAPFDSLNLGHATGDRPADVDENHRRAVRALGNGTGIGSGALVSCYQVHGKRVGLVGAAHRGTIQPATDALVTATPSVLLLLRFADCVPVLLLDPRQQAVGLAHAGWQGIARGVVPATVRAMVERLGCDVRHLQAAIAPAIGPCCYEVGADTLQAVRSALPARARVARTVRGRTHLDLPAAVAAQLRAAGVTQVQRSGLCTACRTDEWFSHRASGGHTGRFGVAIGWQTGGQEGAAG